MKAARLVPNTALFAMLAWSLITARAAQPVTIDTFVRAETDAAFTRYAKFGAFAKLFHIRQPTPLDRQDIVRMNRDTLYSAVLFDLTKPVTIIKPRTRAAFSRCS